MTTPRWTKKVYVRAISACLLILLLLVTFIICLSNFGAFSSNLLSSHDKERHETSKANSLKSLVASFLKEHPGGDEKTTLTDEDDQRISLLNASMPAILLRIPDMKDIDEFWIMYPHKIQVPLHKDDLLYESKRNYSSALNLDNKYPHYKTGHYRNKSSKIWDPHPQYEINGGDAFHFVLRLQQEPDIIAASKFEVTHVWNSSNLRRKDEKADHYEHKECQYKGVIVDDDNSIVAVSLCDGMQGYFRTSSGSFYIEPLEDYSDENTNILHLLYREPRRDVKGDSEKCDLTDSHDHLETNEELELKMLNETKNAHLTSRVKRSIQNNHRLTPHEQLLQRQHQQKLQHQYELHRREVREREIRERQRSGQEIQNRSNTNSSNYHNHRDARRYQQMQQPPPQQQYDHQMYHYRNDFENTLQSSQQQKSDETKEYTIEVLVAVDKKMQEYHGKNLKNYVLTLMSVVSSIYADASIGNSIKIAVVHIMYIEHDLVPDASSGNGVSASGMLLEFCRLKHSHDYQHDTALLLTREQICRSANQRKCDTLGLAELGTMCKPQSCAIVQDNGLSAAFTIAHELGHVLNMPHDDDKRCEEFRSNTAQKQNIMSRMLDHNTHPWSWSNCSRHHASEFLEKDQCSCLLDKPHRDMIEKNGNTMLAGEKFTDDQQCELVFGQGARICSYMPKCSRLWCSQNHKEDNGCRTQHMPWADGTKCGDGEWCQKGECVTRNRSALAPIHGNWGPWSEFGECSRSCGGGVQSAVRNCDNPPPTNGGKYCVGQKIQYRSCNIQDCPNEALDFRAEQCSRFDNNSFNMDTLSNSRWMPKYGLDKKDECKLYCRLDQTSTYFALANRVIDGTPCSYHTFDKCINGVCVPAGCDNELYSTAELDMCGVCKGRNETCESYHGNLTQNQFRKQANYQNTYFVFPVVTIPKGATNIEIIQGSYDDQNYIALRDDHDEYILNSVHNIDSFEKTIYYGGITLEYNGGESSIEKINSTYARQLKRELKVDILSFSPPSTADDYVIKFSYTRSDSEKVVLSNHITNNYNYNDYTPAKRQYVWQMQDWSNCSSLCQGKQIRKASCVELNLKAVVSDSYCRNTAKPFDDFKECNGDCRLGWEAFKSNCSVTCGDGNRTIKYECVQRFRQGTQSKIVEKSLCVQRYETLIFEPCSQHCNEVLWMYHNWSPCSRSCGGGKQNRTSMCISDPVHQRQVHENYCSHLRREELVRYCNQDVNCAEWAYGEESPCSVSCGIGQRVTVISCKQNNELVNPSLCGASPRPKDIIKTCTMPSCDSVSKVQKASYPDVTAARNRNSVPRVTDVHTSIFNNNINNVETTPAASKYEWRTGRWGECSVTCGEKGGKKIRSVRCIDSQSVNYELVDDHYCDHSQKPVDVTNCNEFRCPTWNWGKWGKCTNECKRERQVVCQDHRGKSSDQCPLEMEPHKSEECCHFRWRAMWKPCSVTCGTGVRVKEPICMRLYPRSTDNPHPIKNGTRVDPKFCTHLTMPKYEKSKKTCKSKIPCLHSFRWVIGPWQKCSSGCGTGYSTRNVTCSNGHIESPDACTEPRPIKYRQCENKNHCRWRYGKWKNCTCAGYQKRRITCWDGYKNTAANNCPDEDKPASRQRCTAPPNCSCKSIQHYKRTRTDGEYKINIRGREVEIYCHNMNSDDPSEFVSLRKGNQENYSLFYSKRSNDMSKCENGKGTQDESIHYGTTRFNKVRININTLQIVDDDYQFTHTVGRPQKFATGGDCYSNSGSCPQGDFFVNFEGTGFRMRPSMAWEATGTNGTIEYQIKLEKPYHKVRARCGGYCGSCRPSHRGIFLDVL